MKSPVMLLSSLLDDLRRLEPGVKGLDRDIITIESRFKHEGFGFLSVTLSSLCDALDLGIAVGRFTCPTAFSKARGKALPKFLSGLLCEVFDPMTGNLNDEVPVGIVKFLREFLRIFKKTTLSSKREAKLHSEAVRGFVEADNLIPTVSYDRNKVNLLRDVSRLVLQSLHTVDFENIICRHGPGGVAERLSPNQKWLGLLDSLSREHYLATKYGLDVFASNGGEVSNPDTSWTSSFDDVLQASDQLNGVVQERCFSGLAKLLTVPKSSIARRTITMEPVLNMFIQQGLNTALRDSISSCRILSRCLALTDQSKNQHLAEVGSRTGKYATIDLSSASDLLSLRLVKLVFASKASFLRAMLDCRSSHVDLGNDQILLAKKFAGMGNALTFPVQSIVFATLAICGVLCQKGHRPSYRNVKHAAALVRVYGDDIIVKTEHVCQVNDWLTSFGLKVNQKKSFTTGNFRESCGLDAYKGYDVTPVYLRDWPIASSGTPDQIASLVSTSNQLWMRGLYSGATFLQSLVESFVGPLPLVSKNSPGLGWHSRADANVAHKWDGKLQQLVFRALTIKVIRRPDSLDGYAALGKSLNHLERRMVSGAITEKDHLKFSVMRFKTKLRMRWLPARAG